MKIALVHRYYPMIGGVTTVVDYLKKELEKEHEVEVITNLNTNEKNVKVIPGNHITFYLNAYKYLKKRDFDIIHTQSFPLCYLSPLLKNKVIFSVQGYDEIYEWPKSLYWKIIIQLTTWGKILGYKFVKKLVAISSVIKENLVKKHNIPDKKIEIIHNGVDIERFKPKKTKKSKEIRVFLYGSNTRKGFNKVVRWAPEIIKELPKITFVIVGKKKRIPKELESYFEFHERVDFEKMPDVFNGTDIVILPSINEPFGITAAEGMACGKPTIVSSVSGVADVINNGKNGIISSFEDFPTNIIKLAKDKKLRDKIGKEARKNMIEKLSSSVLAKKHIELYNRVIKGNSL